MNNRPNIPETPSAPIPRIEPERYPRSSLIKVILVAVVIALALVVVYREYVAPDKTIGPSVLLESEFIDLDGDGDPDYLIRGEAIFNCDVYDCPGYIVPTAVIPEVLPTPEVFQQGGGTSLDDPDVGGGGGPPTPEIHASVPDPN
jgi:hypothetical protein